MLNSAAIWKNLNSPRQLFLIAGPCVIENEKLCRQVAASLSKTCRQLGIFYVFKASFDKANRTSGKAFRGPGIEAGLEDSRHDPRGIRRARADRCPQRSAGRRRGRSRGHFANPGVSCRQTDLIEAAVATGKIVNLKKGQFLSPKEMGRVAEKARLAGGK